MVASLGYGTFIFFGLVCLLGAAFVWFLVPETKNLTLEEMDEIFGDEAGNALADKNRLVCTRPLRSRHLPLYPPRTSNYTDIWNRPESMSTLDCSLQKKLESLMVKSTPRRASTWTSWRTEGRKRLEYRDRTGGENMSVTRFVNSIGSCIASSVITI